MTIHAMIELYVKKNPSAIAAISNGQSITYDALNQKANQLAYYLQSIGVKPNTQVALCMERSIDLLIAIVAILKAGGAYLPLDASHPESRLLFILENSTVPILLTKAHFKAKFTRYIGNLTVLDEIQDTLQTQATTNPNTIASIEQLAYVIYTSGSTGKPKGVQIEHQSVLNYYDWFVDYSRMQPEQRMDWSSNYIFDMAITTTIVSLMAGLTIIICEEATQKNIVDYLAYIQKNQIQAIKITPSFFKELLHELQHHPMEFPDLQIIILGGENLRANECIDWLKQYPNHRLINEYGPTEATVGSLHYEVTNIQDCLPGTSIPIGKPGKNMSCYVLSPSGAPVAEGEAGELYIGGLCLARGYLNQPELTQTRFIDYRIECNSASYSTSRGSSAGSNDLASIVDPADKPRDVEHGGMIRLYKTNDLCRKLPSGFYEYLGRLDQQIKIRGFRVELGEIERCLAELEAIEDVAVLIRENNQHDKLLIAYYSLVDHDLKLTHQQLREFLLTHLPDYMIPSAFVCVEHFPLTANGKLDHQALPAPPTFVSHHYVAPRSNLERKIADIWSEGIGVVSIGMNDNFFELGGHSLIAARLVSKINQQLDCNLSLPEFYKALTIAKLTRVIKQRALVAVPDLLTSSYERSSKSPVNKSDTATRAQAREKSIPLSDFQLLLWTTNRFAPEARKLNIITRKRLVGTLNIPMLTQAFEAVFKKHDIFSYQVTSLYPSQYIKQDLAFKIQETDCESCSAQEQDSILLKSVNELLNYYPWPKNSRLIMARLFYLSNNTIELQLCIPHIISDGTSIDLLLSDLSTYYQRYSSGKKPHQSTHAVAYQDYVIKEQLQINKQMDSDAFFWKDYLNDAHLFQFPSQYIVKQPKSKLFNYSTYIPLAEETLLGLVDFCTKNHINLNDALCAAIGKALSVTCDDVSKNKSIFMTIVKSTRNDHEYDETLGCFIRMDSIKMDMTGKLNLIDLSKQIHATLLKHWQHQTGSSLLKLACLNPFYHNKNAMKYHFLKAISSLYIKLAKSPKLNHKTMDYYPRLASFNMKDRFLINVNLWNNFIPTQHSKKNAPLFGLNPTPVALYQYDFLKINSIFDVCFMRDDNENQPYLVISANLTPDFRQVIANEIIRILNVDMVTHVKNTPKESVLHE